MSQHKSLKVKLLKYKREIIIYESKYKAVEFFINYAMSNLLKLLSMSII